MKRGLILLLILVLIPIASAEIVLDDDFTTYNLGNFVNVGGYIELDEDYRGLFKLDVVCGDDSGFFNYEVIDVEANEKYFFDKNNRLPYGSEGLCKFKATFKGESTFSNEFEISNEPKGDVFINKENFQLGDVLEVSGDILYLDNNKFEGMGIFSLMKDGEASFADTFEIFDGDVSFSTILENLPAGNYDLKLDIYDFYGNEKTFDLGDIDIGDELSVSVNLDKDDYLPEDKLEITGTVNDDTGDYRVTFEFDEGTITESFEERNFDYFFKIRGDISSGSHNVLIKVVDDFGNYFEKDLELNIIPVAKRLEINTNKDSYLPEEVIELYAVVYDQGDELYEDMVKLKVLNSKNNKILDVEVNSGSVYGLELEKYAIPGNYMIEATSLDFEETNTFVVEELQKIDAYYDLDRLKISNEGNANIDGTFTAYLNDESFIFDLKNSPSEIESYDLRGKVEEGIYNLKVNFNEQEIDVGEVYIENKGFGSMLTGAVAVDGKVKSWVYVVIIIIIIVVLLFLIYRPKTKNVNLDRQKDFREAQEKLKRVRADRAKKKPKKLFHAKEISKEEAKDFRETMVKKMKKK